MKLVLLFSLLFSLFSFHAHAEVSEFYLFGRKYLLARPDFIPGHKPFKMPLVVLLHGCKQDAEIIMKGTRLKEAAEKNNFFLLVPQQEIFHNSDHCWNWFYPINQSRHPMGEIGQVIAAVEALKASMAIDTERLFVIGMSAGGAMAHNMLACYPDYFKAVAVHSGLAYKVAENSTEANDVLTRESQKSPEVLGKLAFECSQGLATEAKLQKLLVIHGLKDMRVNPIHSNLIIDATKVMMKKLEKPISTKLIQVPELAHAWGGGLPISPNFDEKAPSSTDEILNFFELN